MDVVPNEMFSYIASMYTTPDATGLSAWDKFKVGHTPTHEDVQIAAAAVEDYVRFAGDFLQSHPFVKTALMPHGVTLGFGDGTDVRVGATLAGDEAMEPTFSMQIGAAGYGVRPTVPIAGQLF